MTEWNELSVEALQRVLSSRWDVLKGNLKEEHFYDLLDQENFDRSIKDREELRATLKKLGFFEGGTKFTTYSASPIIQEKLEEFWAELRNYTAVDSVIELNTPFLGYPKLSKSMLIRHAYQQLYALINEHFQKFPYGAITITGNPGTGKTFFAFYLLYILAKSNEHVIYYYPDLLGIETVIHFEANGVEIGGLRQFRNILKSPTTWFIVDGICPPYFPARTVQVTAPRLSPYKEMRKIRDHIEFYMPVWTLEEILECRDKCFSDLSDQAVTDLFEKWGGIPRYVLKHATNPTAMVLLEDAISTVDVSKILHFVGEISGPDDLVHHLIHLAVDETFQTPKFRFASNYVADRIIQQSYQQRDSVHRLLHILEDEFRCGFTFREHLYESLVHSILRNGGKFKIRELVAKNNTKLKPQSTVLLNSTKPMEFSSLSEIVEPGKYYIPKSASFAGTAIVVPDCIFQIITGEPHPIPVARLVDYVTQLSTIHTMREKSIQRIFFVVPPGCFQSFVKQPLLTDKEGFTEKLNSVKQYALCLSL